MNIGFEAILIKSKYKIILPFIRLSSKNQKEYWFYRSQKEAILIQSK